MYTFFYLRPRFQKHNKGIKHGVGVIQIWRFTPCCYTYVRAHADKHVLSSLQKHRCG